jgi:hypothetical protein
METSIKQGNHVSLDISDDRPSTADDRATVGKELHENSVHQAHAIPRPSVAPEDRQEAVGDVEYDGHNDVVPDNEAVSLPIDLIAADDHSDAEMQPEWGVAPDEFHAGSSDDTAGDEGFRQLDISGGEADGAADSERPESDGVDDSDAAGTPSPDGSEAEDEAAATSCTDDAGKKAESPQPYRRTPLPSDVDWRDLKPRCYGNALPPLDSSERQGLKASIVNRGFLGKILIDEWLAIIDGNTRWEICLKTGIAPEVEVIEGLSDEEKEELAFSFNADRRQLKDPEVEQQVLDARFENLFKLQEQDPKKWTQDRIADALGVSRATVSARLQSRHISNGGNVSKPDARRRYEADIECQAVRLVKEGMAPSVVARMLLMHPKAVQRAVTKEKRREAGGAAAKGGKSQQVAATQQTEDLAASDGVPEPHRRILADIGKETQDYIKWLEDGFADAQKEITAAADNVEKVLKLAISASQLLAAANLWLKSNCGNGGEVDVEESPPGDLCPDGDRYKPDTILRGIVLRTKPDEVFVGLPDGRIGVIDNRDNRLAQYGLLEVGNAYRVRVEGFDSDRDLVIVLPQGQQTAAPPERTAALGTDLDEGSKTDAEDAACEADVETTEVTK